MEQEIRAQYFGRGHTNGDAVIYFPALAFLFTNLEDDTGVGELTAWVRRKMDALLRDGRSW